MLRFLLLDLNFLIVFDARQINRNVMDTTATYNMLQCSRQNLSYMVREEKITPIICGTKENLYLKGEVERAMSE